MPGSNGDVRRDGPTDAILSNAHDVRPGQIVYGEYGEHASRFEARSYFVTDEGDLAATPSTVIVYDVCWWTRFLEVCHQLFVPRGYPGSVTGDYLAFQLWDSVQVFFLTVIETLSMKILMIGLAFSEMEAWANGAAVTWILREISELAVQLYYNTNWRNKLQLGCECKKWRSVSSVVSGISVGVELLLYSMLNHVALVLCIAAVIRTMANMYDRITREVIVNHQAKENNLADVQRKGNRQSTCARIFGMFFGVFLISTFSYGEEEYVRQLYISLTACHLFAGYKAIHTLELRTLNFQRYALLLRMYLVRGAVYTPKEVNRHDRMITDKRINIQKLCGYTIKLGASIATTDIPPYHEMALLCKAYEGNSYLLCINSTSRVVYICLDKNSTPVDEIRAVYQAVLMALAISILTYGGDLPILERYPNPKMRYPLQQLRVNVLQCCARVGLLHNCLKCSRYDPVPYIAMVASQLAVFKDFPQFVEELRDAGWSTSNHHLKTEGWTAKWTSHYSSEDSDAHLVEFFSNICRLPLHECLHHELDNNHGGSIEYCRDDQGIERDEREQFKQSV